MSPEQKALQQVAERYPDHDVTVDRYGAAILKPRTTQGYAVPETDRALDRLRTAVGQSLGEDALFDTVSLGGK